MLHHGVLQAVCFCILFNCLEAPKGEYFCFKEKGGSSESNIISGARVTSIKTRDKFLIYKSKWFRAMEISVHIKGIKLVLTKAQVPAGHFEKYRYDLVQNSSSKYFKFHVFIVHSFATKTCNICVQYSSSPFYMHMRANSESTTLVFVALVPASATKKLSRTPSSS